MSKMRKTGLILCLALLALAFTSVVYANCTTYHNSRIAYIEGMNLCAYTGSGCTECVNSGGGSCVTNGSSCTVGKKRPGT